jgi:phosphoribosylformimino-5-aminoimidazole carboxamide ribotide isomerase
MSAFTLIPAIDIRAGMCVRLLKGDFDRETRYAHDPVELAQRYAELGARVLHIVDLDGAKRGRPVNLDLIRKIAVASAARIQLGGGIRDEHSLAAALEVADRVVIGSTAVAEPARVRGWLEEYGPERFTLGLDVRVDANAVAHVTTHGWTQDSGLALGDALMPFTAVGLRHVLCTDVDKDGAMEGPNTALYSDCVARWPMIAWQASGGVRDASDLTRLAGLGVAGAISGRALLEGKLTDEEIRRFLPNA